MQRSHWARDRAFDHRDHGPSAFLISLAVPDVNLQPSGIRLEILDIERNREKAYPMCERLRNIAMKIIGQANLIVTEQGMAHPNILPLTLLPHTFELQSGGSADPAENARFLSRCCFENLFIIGRPTR